MLLLFASSVVASMRCSDVTCNKPKRTLEGTEGQPTCDEAVREACCGAKNMGAPPLLVALWRKQDNGAMSLLNCNHSVGAVDRRGQTALHLATKKGNVALVEEILSRNATVDTRSGNGCTALILAARGNNSDIVELLLSHNASIDASSRDGQTALTVASREGNSNIVELLLSHNASIDARNNDGHTALTLASREGYSDIVKLLLSHNASIGASNNDGYTALTLASREGNSDIVKLLLSQNASIDERTHTNYTALHLAAKKGQSDVVKLLLSLNASIDAVTVGGESALHLAAKRGQFKVVEQLLSYDASVDSRSIKGQTALHMAAGEGLTEIVELLLDAGAQIDARGHGGKTALHFAAKAYNKSQEISSKQFKLAKNYAGVLLVLLSRCADTSLMDEKNKTAMYYANQFHGFQEAFCTTSTTTTNDTPLPTGVATLAPERSSSANLTLNVPLRLTEQSIVSVPEKKTGIKLSTAGDGNDTAESGGTHSTLDLASAASTASKPKMAVEPSARDPKLGEKTSKFLMQAVSKSRLHISATTSPSARATDVTTLPVISTTTRTTSLSGTREPAQEHSNYSPLEIVLYVLIAFLLAFLLAVAVCVVLRWHSRRTFLAAGDDMISRLPSFVSSDPGTTSNVFV